MQGSGTHVLSEDAFASLLYNWRPVDRFRTPTFKPDDSGSPSVDKFMAPVKSSYRAPTAAQTPPERPPSPFHEIFKREKEYDKSLRAAQLAYDSDFMVQPSRLSRRSNQPFGRSSAPSSSSRLLSSERVQDAAPSAHSQAVPSSNLKRTLGLALSPKAFAAAPSQLPKKQKSGDAAQRLVDHSQMRFCFGGSMSESEVAVRRRVKMVGGYVEPH